MGNALIDDVRRLAGASVTDATDTDITRELERARLLVRCELRWSPVLIAPGTVEYRLARVDQGWGEYSPGTAGQLNGGTLAVGTLRDVNGTVLGGWSIERDGWVNFGTPGSIGSAYFFQGYGYDVHAAAANVLEDMASQQLRQYDVTLGGDQHKRSQKAANLMEAAKLQRKRSLPRQVEVKRSDEQWHRPSRRDAMWGRTDNLW